jgi:Ninjurin
VQIPDEHLDTPRLAPPDLNIYQSKKTLAQGMMDLALFSSNANQLRYVLELCDAHPYYMYFISIGLLVTSLVLQVGVGVGLAFHIRYNLDKREEIHMAERINNYLTIAILLIVVINIFVSAFGVVDSKYHQ